MREEVDDGGDSHQLKGRSGCHGSLVRCSIPDVPAAGIGTGDTLLGMPSNRRLDMTSQVCTTMLAAGGQEQRRI